MMGTYWQAAAGKGAGGHYVSGDPRIMIFFEEIARSIVMSTGALRPEAGLRPMARALYLPAGQPMQTRFTAAHEFSHLDIHLHRDRLLRILEPSLGRSAALAAIARPVELADPGMLTGLAEMLVAQVTAPSKHDLFAETIAAGIVSGLLDLGPMAPQAPPAPPEPGGARLTAAQLRRLRDGFDAAGGRRLAVAELAAMVGLSESWFGHVFRNSTGMTPLQWQTRRRVDMACGLLAGSDRHSLTDIAARLGFADQAHLTRTFRQVTGETPAAWRRAQRAG